MQGKNVYIIGFTGIVATCSAGYLYYRYATSRSENQNQILQRQQSQLEENEQLQEMQIMEQVEDMDDMEEDLEENDAGKERNTSNLFLVFFGTFILTLILSISIVYAIVEDSFGFPSENQYFTPLVWISIGIIMAASAEASHLELDIFREKPTNKGFDEKPLPMEHFPPFNGPDQGAEENDREDLENVMKVADELFEEEKWIQLLAFLKQQDGLLGNVEILWRLARVCNALIDCDLIQDKAEKKSFAIDAFEYASMAVEANPTHAAAHKWTAIALSSIGQFKSTKDKIANAFKIKDHIQRAIELDQNDATSRNILGQWCLALADMSWIERRAAAALFGTPPAATYEQALENFLAAESISPGFWKKNAFLIAQTYYKLKDISNTKLWIDKAELIETKTKEDECVQRELNALSQKVK